LEIERILAALNRQGDTGQMAIEASYTAPALLDVSLAVHHAPGRTDEGAEGAYGGAGDTFNTQDVANTLWACATMGLDPGAVLMRELGRQAESQAGTFSFGLDNSKFLEVIIESLHMY
jgi:hypothetical protein